MQKNAHHPSLSILVLFCIVALSSIAHCQPKPSKGPSNTHIFPAGGRRGSVIKVRVGAECIPPGTNFYITGDGVTAPNVLGSNLPFTGEPAPRRVPTEIPITHPREWESELDISSAAPLGAAYWRLSCASGGTTSRPFLIGDLPEWIEVESNSTAEQAEAVTLPITLNGQICGERDVDYYRFRAEAKKVVVCEMISARIGSRLDPIVEILTPTGESVPVQQIHCGTDPVIAFQSEQDGEYLLRVSNISWHGGPAHVYRINLTTRPYVCFAFPSGGQVGTSREVKLFTLTGFDKYHVIRTMVKFPESAGPFNHSIAPGVETSLWADELTNIVEAEENDTIKTATPIEIETTVHGRISGPSDEDWFQFSSEKDQSLMLDCRQFPEGGPAMLQLVLVDSSGKQLVHQRSIETRDNTCSIHWKAPIAGEYYARVTDLQSDVRNGESVYRLSIQSAKPDFEISLDYDDVDVVQGAEAAVDVFIKRIGGFNEAVELSIEGLPEGITLKDTKIAAGKDKGRLKFVASEDAVVQCTALQVVGHAKIGDESIQRIARAKHLGVDCQGASIGSPTIDNIHLIVQHKPMFKLVCSEAYRYAHRGTIYPYEMEVERLEGYKDAIFLQQGDRQNRDMDGVKILTATLPAEQTKVIVPIYLPETMHINVQSQTQLYTQAYVQFTDKHNRRQSMLHLAEKRNMIRTLPPVVKLKAMDEVVTCDSGDELKCRLFVQRTSNFQGPLQLELAESSAGFRMRPVTIAAGQTKVEALVHRASAGGTGQSDVLKFRATGDLYADRQVVTEASILIQSSSSD